jgi:imidazolonepropionase-like amidohydrolase
MCTAPYLEGKGAFTPVMHQLTDAADARRMVNFWADQGATSFKAYMNITRDQLRAAVEEAHKRGLKVTGTLFDSVTKRRPRFGIDNLEHGLFADSEFVPNKQPINAHKCFQQPASTRSQQRASAGDHPYSGR